MITLKCSAPIHLICMNEWSNATGNTPHVVTITPQAAGSYLSVRLGNTLNLIFLLDGVAGG
jgi:hypothetical protein